MDILKANTNFSVESLLSNDLNKKQFQVDFLPMWKFLDGYERKVGGFDKVQMKDIFEAIYEYATIAVSLDKADTTTRIDYLNQKNLELFIKCENLTKENELLKQRHLENQITKES